MKPNTIPLTDLKSISVFQLKLKYARALGNSLCDYFLKLQQTKMNVEHKASKGAKDEQVGTGVFWQGRLFKVV